jgi:beta-fructofuranosidase
VGNFDGEHFYPQKRFDTESGPDYYAPQSFEDEQGRRISIGWIPTWRSERPISQQVTGALTVPREVTYHNGVLRHFPIQEFSNRLTSSDPHVLVDQNTITFFDGKKNLASRTYPSVECVDIIRDKNILEVFINKGEYTATFWYFE